MPDTLEKRMLKEETEMKRGAMERRERGSVDGQLENGTV